MACTIGVARCVLQRSLASPVQRGIGFIEGDEGKVHPTCKDVVAETVSYVETDAPSGEQVYRVG